MLVMKPDKKKRTRQETNETLGAMSALLAFVILGLLLLGLAIVVASTS